MNKHIKKIALSRLTTLELIAFAGRICKIVSAHSQGIEYLNDRLEQIKNSIARLESAGQYPRKLPFTKELTQKNTARCIALRNLLAFLTAMARMDQRPVAQNCALFLLKNIKPREKRIDRIGQAKRSGAIITIMNFLATPQAQEHISHLQIQDLVAELANTQQQFEETYQQKIIALSIPRNIVRKERPETAYAIDHMLIYIDGSVQECPDFAVMAFEINELITQAMAKVRSRITRRKHKSIELPGIHSIANVTSRSIV